MHGRVCRRRSAPFDPHIFKLYMIKRNACSRLSAPRPTRANVSFSALFARVSVASAAAAAAVCRVVLIIIIHTYYRGDETFAARTRSKTTIISDLMCALAIGQVM